MGNRRLIFFSLAIFLLLSFSDNHGRKARKRFFHKHIEGPVYIEVVKSDYELKVYDQDGWYATYPVVFGSKSLEDKMMEGDRKTPEGEYHIVIKKSDAKWD